MSIQNSYIEAPTPNVILFDDTGFMETIKDKWDHKAGVLIQ